MKIKNGFVSVLNGGNYILNIAHVPMCEHCLQHAMDCSCLFFSELKREVKLSENSNQTEFDFIEEEMDFDYVPF